MSQHVRSGGALVGSGRSFQADQAFQAFKGEFNPPSQAIEGENIVRRELLRLERSYQDHPVGGLECLLRELVASALGLAARLASRFGSRLLASNRRYPVERLAFLLIGQFKV